MKKESALKVYSILLTLIIFAIGSIIYLASAGFSLTATIEENQYIYYMARRDKVAYDLYRELSEAELGLYDVQIAKDYSERSSTIQDLIYQYQELETSVEDVLEIDKKLLSLDLGVKLSDSVNSLYNEDVIVSEQISHSLSFLEEFKELNTLLTSINAAEKCHSDIDFTASNLTISNSLNNCISTYKTLTTNNESLKITSSYITNMLSLWNTEKQLYQELLKNDAYNASLLNNEINTKGNQVSELKKDSAKEISEYINDIQ